MRNIKEGDVVNAFWVEGQLMKATVENVPANTGDLWYLRSEDKKSLHAINPNCSNFESIIKVEVSQ